MGFAVLPEPIKSGVYYDPKLDFLIQVTLVTNFPSFLHTLMGVEVWYKKRQKYPKYIDKHLIKNEFIWIGEL
jgi:hypothetical protein